MVTNYLIEEHFCGLYVSPKQKAGKNDTNYARNAIDVILPLFWVDKLRGLQPFLPRNGSEGIRTLITSNLDKLYWGL